MGSHRFLLRLASLVFVTLACGGVTLGQGTKVIHVNDDPPGGGLKDGTSWPDAYDDLSDGLFDAWFYVTNTPGATAWVVVAEGHYEPSQPPAWISGPVLDRQWSFGLYTSVEMYGGFDTTEDVDPLVFKPATDREGSYFNTILSGDIGTDGNSLDNVYNVVTIGDTAISMSGQRLDGFRIMDGRADELDGATFGNRGAGVTVAESSGVVLENLTVESGWARRGGAVAVRGGSFRMKYCTLEDNYARLRGGGLYAEEVNGASYVHNVVVRGNIVGTVHGGTDVTQFQGQWH